MVIFNLVLIFTKILNPLECKFLIVGRKWQACIISFRIPFRISPRCTGQDGWSVGYDSFVLILYLIEIDNPFIMMLATLSCYNHLRYNLGGIRSMHFYFLKAFLLHSFSKSANNINNEIKPNTYISMFHKERKCTVISSCGGKKYPGKEPAALVDSTDGGVSAHCSSSPCELLGAVAVFAQVHHRLHDTEGVRVLRRGREVSG